MDKKEFSTYSMRELNEMKQKIIREIARREEEDFQKRVEEICQKIKELKEKHPLATWYIGFECEYCGSLNDVNILDNDITPDLFCDC